MLRLDTTTAANRFILGVMDPAKGIVDLAIGTPKTNATLTETEVMPPDWHARHLGKGCAIIMPRTAHHSKPCMAGVEAPSPPLHLPPAQMQGGEI